MVRAFVFRPLGSESVCPRACGIKVCRALVKGRWHACVPLLLAFFAETFCRAQVSCLTSNSIHCYKGVPGQVILSRDWKRKGSKYLNIVRISRVENLGFTKEINQRLRCRLRARFFISQARKRAPPAPPAGPGTRRCARPGEPLG